MKKFKMQDEFGLDIQGHLEERHVFVTHYGRVIKGKKPAELNVGESCLKGYSVCGQKEHKYLIIRVE